ncbi:hypothetical protein KSF73_06895 [Burkholderiaceae bacterium DAT-1]|nr:hypothetical protein [Burkholderiaceae bacterium DAT-1]
MPDPFAPLAEFQLNLSASVSMTVAEFLTKCDQAGIHGYVCGGAVRDCVLGQPFNDVDFTFHHEISAIRDWMVETFGTPIRFADLQFGLIKVGRDDASEFDITMWRSTESIGDAERLAGVHYQLTDSLLADARNRDLSMNCLFWHPDEGCVDPVGHGLEDAQARRIRIAADTRKQRVDYRLALRALLF